MAKNTAEAKTAKGRAGGPVRVSVSVPSIDYAELKGIALSKRVSIAWVVREAVASYLEARAPLSARREEGERS